MKSILLPAALVLALTGGGCTTVASTVAAVTTSLSTASPTQAKTVAEAAQATKIIEDGLDAYVTTGHPSKAILDELNVLVPALHSTLVAAENAQSNGNSAAIAAGLAAFNEALAAVQGYETKQGVPQ